MAQAGRSTIWFAAGSIAGGALVLAAYIGWFAPDKPPAELPAHVGPFVTAPEPQARPTAIVPAPEETVASTCPSQPLAAARDPEDGRFMLRAALTPAAPTDPAAFLTVAREAAQEGRMRDAEVALMAACHVAEKSSGVRSAPVADVKSEMGQHYVALAAREHTDAVRDGLLQRASTLFTESASTYASALGKNASKTRMAEQRLAALRDPEVKLPEPAPVVVAAPRPAPPPDTNRLGAARSSSLADRPPLRSEDLRQVDSDLERLYAQARAVTRDPAGLQRRHQQALAQRSACQGDENCLRSWYAQRKRQLFDEF